MKVIAWLAAGFALLGLKGYLAEAGDLDLMVSGVPLSASHLSTIALIATSACFYRALRSALAGIVGKGATKPAAAPSPTSPKPHAASRIFAAPAEDDFDADAAFERYMKQREAAQEEATQAEIAPAAKSDAPPPPRPQFGRRVL